MYFYLLNLLKTSILFYAKTLKCARFARVLPTSDVGPATMDPRPRHQARDPRPLVKLEFVLVSLLIFFFFETSVKKEKKGVQISGLKNIAHRSIGMICSRRLFVA